MAGSQSGAGNVQRLCKSVQMAFYQKKCSINLRKQWLKGKRFRPSWFRSDFNHMSAEAGGWELMQYRRQTCDMREV